MAKSPAIFGDYHGKWVDNLSPGTYYNSTTKVTSSPSLVVP